MKDYKKLQTSPCSD